MYDDGGGCSGKDAAVSKTNQRQPWGGLDLTVRCTDQLLLYSMYSTGYEYTQSDCCFVIGSRQLRYSKGWRSGVEMPRRPKSAPAATPIWDWVSAALSSVDHATWVSAT